jgi:hypothetical protein
MSLVRGRSLVKRASVSYCTFEAYMFQNKLVKNTWIYVMAWLYDLIKLSELSFQSCLKRKELCVIFCFVRIMLGLLTWIGMASETASLLTNPKLAVLQTHPILMSMTQILEHLMLYLRLQILPLLHFIFPLWVLHLHRRGKYI